MPYTLEYKDRYRRTLETRIESDTSDSVVFASIPDNTPTRLITEWTGRQYTKLLSAVMVGSDLMFPDEADEIIWQLIKVVHQPIDPEFEETGCTEYLPSANFIKFFPDNPYIAGDTSAGWNKEAWFTWPQFDTLFPDWFDNWLNGAISSLTNYQATDVLFNLESIPINPIDAFLNGGGILPKIEIRFTGSGQINLTLLSFPLGGKAVIELDQEPNVLDILTGGILDPAAFIVELNRDILNFPPDEYPIVQIPLDVTTSGNHTLYICYVPTLDDSLIPVAFGGGFRSIELCGFSEQGNMGIEQIVWDGCQLKSITAGVETVIVTAEQIEACLDIPSGGGGGGSSMKVTNYELRPANFSTSSVSYVNATDWAQSHAFTKQNAYIEVRFLARSNTGALAKFQITLDTGIADDGIEAELNNSADFRTVVIGGAWSGINASTKTIQLQVKVDNPQAVVSSFESMTITIIEFDDASDIFVEDIRIFEGELQKKIGGVWLNVSDSFEAIIASLQSQVSAAVANAAAAVSTANNALTVAQGAVNVNNTQNTRLTALENFQEDAELSLSQNALTLIDHENRIAALEAASGDSSPYLDFGVWSQEFSWVDAQINGIAPFTLGLGSLTSLGVAATIESFPQVVVNFSPIINNQITHVAAKIIRLGHTNPMEVQIEINGTDESRGRLRQVTGSAGVHDVWCRFPNIGASGGITIQLQSANGDRFYLNGLKLIGRGSNPFI